MEKAPKQKKTSGDQKCGSILMAAAERGYGIGVLWQLLYWRAVMPVFEMRYYSGDKYGVLECYFIYN